MKILYAIQGTGNGHVSRAREIVPILQKKGDVDVLISGIQADIDVPFPVKYRFKGLSFVFGKNGGVDMVGTYMKMDMQKLSKDVNTIPVEQYDLVLNDFEPVTAWACKQRKIPCIGLSHQNAVLSPKAPKPKKKDVLGKLVLSHYAPVTAKYGFHFSAYDKNIFTPVIRKEVRDLKPEKKEHYTVYLPAYSDEKILKHLSEFKEITWEVFSKHNKSVLKEGNITIQPITNDGFLKSLETCKGIICGAGFETPAEALYLGKKLLVIPMKAQYEQQCNAAALKKMGVSVVKSLKKKHLGTINSWLKYGKAMTVYYKDLTEEVVDLIIRNHYRKENEISTIKLDNSFDILEI